jgi:magnesium chelatase subunit I
VTTGEQVSARAFLDGLPDLGGADTFDRIIERLDASDDGERAGAIELALEGLYLARKVGKEQVDGQTVYG